MTQSGVGVLNPRSIRALAMYVAAGAFIYLAAILWAGWEQTVLAIYQIGIWPLAALAVFSSTAYLWRFWRWEYCLRYFGYRVPLGLNLQVYVSGLALTTSPGKLGETVRSVLLLHQGVRAAHSLGTFLADRLSDVLGVCLLGAIASALGGHDVVWGFGFFVVLVGVSRLGSFAVLHPAGIHVLQRVVDHLRWPPLRGGQAMLSSWAELWTIRRVCLFCVMAFFAYGSQAVVFSILCLRAGIDITMADGVFIFVTATLFGAVSMVPGGLGAMEASLLYHLLQHGASEHVAISVTVATRLLTLWMGVVLGIKCMALVAARRP